MSFNLPISIPPLVLPNVVLDAASDLPHEISGHHINTGKAFGFRHFTFILKNDTGFGTIVKNPVVVELNINPEDLQHDTPYRVTATQTLGGAFVDVWGEGVKRIVLRGHTGWLRQKTPVQNDDGFDNIFNLRDKVFNAYFDIREKAAASLIQRDIEQKLVLTLVDRLHETAYRIVPESFKLLRNRARPLLHMYEVSFVIVNPDSAGASLDLKQGILKGSDKTKSLWNGFDITQGRFDALKKTLSGIGGPFGKVLTDITSQGSGMAGMFKGLLTAKEDISQGLAGIRNASLQVTQAIHVAMGTIQSYADLSGIAADIKYVFADVKSVVGDLDCLIQDFQHFGLFTFQNIHGTDPCGALYGIPSSPLQKTQNTFDTIRNGTSTTQLQGIANSISGSAQDKSLSILTTDTPSNLIGRGNISI